MNKKGVLLGPQIILLPACKLWCIRPPLEVFYLWNIVSKCKPADAFLPRTCVSTCPTWQNSVTLRRRTQSSPLWSSWTTSTISAPSVTYSMASSTASTTNGETELQCSEKNQYIHNYLRYYIVAAAQLFSYSLSYWSGSVVTVNHDDVFVSMQPLCDWDHEPGSVHLS